MAEPLYDYEKHRWVPQCPYGDICSGCDAAGACSRAPQPGPFDVFRRNEENLPHLLDVAVQILRDKGLFETFEEVLHLDWEASRDE